MAARENQGLQIALIIFVMLTIVLIVTTFLFFNSYKNEMAKNQGLMTENANKDKAARDATAEAEAYKNLIGAAATDKLDAIQAAGKKDIDTYAKSAPEGKQNYRYLVEYLGTELRNANARIADITAHEKELDDKIKSDETAKAEEMAKYKKDFESASKDLETERTKFNSDRKDLTQSKDALEKKFDSKRKEFDQLTKDSGEKITGLSSDKDRLTKLLQDKNNEILRGQKANEVPDGKITWIDQRTRVVWINLGSGDGLRRLTSFSVYDEHDVNPAAAKSKGKIEVTRLIDRHLAEARIVEDDLSNPLMPGDNIFSPFEPGRAEHFALVGVMDIDGDGESDRQKIHDLIALNGGVIDEEVTEDDKKTGQMSITTKYLVRGEAPKSEAQLKNYSEILDEAQTLGVRVVRIKDFLDYLGYKPEDRTVNLGKFANPSDFRPRLPEGVQRKLPGNDPGYKDQRKPRPTTQKVTY